MSDKDTHPVPEQKVLDLMRECLYLDSHSRTGLSWRKPTSNRVKAGASAFTAGTHSGGYFYGRFCGISVRAHRVVFYLHNGYWPTGIIDHVDGNPKNNAPDNLRDSTRALNSANMNSRGYFWNKKSKKWKASVKKGNLLVAEFFDNEEEARRWYEMKKLELYPELEGKFQWNQKVVDTLS